MKNYIDENIIKERILVNNAKNTYIRIDFMRLYDPFRFAYNNF